jgi:very-short-patch-repair endonuclease
LHSHNAKRREILNQFEHSLNNGRFAIGIECDGAMYHSARTARERDRLRQAVLENMGWKIYRVWSTDWIKDSYAEGERLTAAINQAIVDSDSLSVPQSLSNDDATDFLKITTVSANESEQ